MMKDDGVHSGSKQNTGKNKQNGLNLTEMVSILVQRLASIGDENEQAYSKINGQNLTGESSPISTQADVNSPLYHTASLGQSPASCYSSEAIPAGFFFQLLCKKVDLPDEHSVSVLAILNRLCNMGFYQGPRLVSKNKEFDECHSQYPMLTINTKIINR